MLCVAKKTSPSQVRIIKKPLRAWKERKLVDNTILILSFIHKCMYDKFRIPRTSIKNVLKIA